MLFAILDIDPDAFGRNSSPHPYSFTTMESFQATRWSKPKLIKLITSFLQSTHLCPFLGWFQGLSDPALSQFQCAQMADKHPGREKKRNKGIKKIKKKKIKKSKGKQLPAELANSSAQKQINTRESQYKGGGSRDAGLQQPLQLHPFHLHKTEASVSSPFSIYKQKFNHVNTEILLASRHKDTGVKYSVCNICKCRWDCFLLELKFLK